MVIIIIIIIIIINYFIDNKADKILYKIKLALRKDLFSQSTIYVSFRLKKALSFEWKKSFQFKKKCSS